MTDDERRLIEDLQYEVKVLKAAARSAFVQGAQWWEYHKEGATMWGSDSQLAWEEAHKMEKNGTLGKDSPIRQEPNGGAEPGRTSPDA